jgi:hypothetical protein
MSTPFACDQEELVSMTGVDSSLQLNILFIPHYWFKRTRYVTKTPVNKTTTIGHCLD